MTTTPSITNEVELESTTLNFSICSWMITELKLTGSSLVLFAYIYAKTMNNMHPSTTSLSALTRISGLTKQTVSRAIDKLPYILKNVSQDNDNGFYAYNYYRVDSFALLSFLESLGKDIYKDFIQSFKNDILRQFKNAKNANIDIANYLNNVVNINSKTINEQLAQFKTVRTLANDDIKYNSLQEAITYITKQNTTLIEWLTSIKSLLEKEQNSSSRFTISTSSNTAKNNKTTSALENEPKQKSCKGRNPKDMGLGSTFTKKEQSNKTKQATTSLLTKSAPKDKVAEKLQKRAAAMQPYKDIALNYVVSACDNNQELLELLYNYIEVCIFKSKTGCSATMFEIQFKEQLKELSKFLYIEDRIDAVRVAFMNGYRGFVYAKPWELDRINSRRESLKSVPQLIDEFVQTYDNDEQIRNMINKYWGVVSNGRGLTTDQFKLMLQQLTDDNISKDNVLVLITDAYTHGYTKWSWSLLQKEPISTPTSTRRKLPFSIGVPNNEVDPEITTTLEEREKAVNDMWVKHCLFLHPEIKEALMKYVTETSVGKAMNYKQVCAAIDNLAQRRVEESDMLKCINNAIEHNYSELCLVDEVFEEKIKKNFKNKDDFIKSVIAARRRECKEFVSRNANTEKAKELEALLNPVT